MFDFRCADGHVHEALVAPEQRHRPCHKCGHTAQRMIGRPTIHLEGITGAFPGAAMKWEANRESHMRKEQKHKEKHGTWT